MHWKGLKKWNAHILTLKRHTWVALQLFCSGGFYNINVWQSFIDNFFHIFDPTTDKKPTCPTEQPDKILYIKNKVIQRISTTFRALQLLLHIPVTKAI